MFDNMWFVAALWLGMAIAASLISIRLGITVALIEIMMGIVAGNFGGIHETTPWIDFLALTGSLALTFLAGAEIDPVSLKKNLKASLIMGMFSFAVPFIGVWVFAQYALGWGVQQAQIAGLALSTTSVAIIYSVIVEKGLSDTSVGKLMLTAVFITDLATVMTLGILFANFNVWTLVFIVSVAASVYLLPFLAKAFMKKYEANQVSEPEIKLILFFLFVLAGLAVSVNSEGVLPAFFMGLAAAGLFVKDKTLLHRIRTIAFTIFTPFYFIRAGLFISLDVIVASFGLVSVLLLLKIVFKTAGVWPVSRAFNLSVKISNFNALLFSTGITFGTIAAMYGFNNGIIDQNQYSILVTVVILSALIPTVIAQKFFQPSLSEMNSWNNK